MLAKRHLAASDPQSAAIEAAHQELQSFVYRVSHDLNAPMRTMSQFAELFQQRYGKGLDEKAHDYLGYIMRAGEKGQAMLESLLQYSRLNSLPVPKQDGSSQEMVDLCIQQLQDVIVESNATVTAHNLPVVRARTTQWTQLFYNLIDNALKFRAPGRAPIIRIHAQDDARGWLFCVEDNGIGIEPEHRQAVFEVFRQLHRPEEYPGIGMGLTLAKRIVANHDGNIWIESALRDGVCVYFTLPRAEHTP